MVGPVGGVSLVDGLAALTRVGVSGRATPAHELRPVSPSRGRHDRVELSGQTRDPAAAEATGPVRALEELTDTERQHVQALATRDREVRAHEQAHKAAGGTHAGEISFSFSTGPDGRRYAVGGEVPIDLSPVQGDPHATIAKMQQVRRAALAPAQPSAADRQVAARAAQLEREARAELGQDEGPAIDVRNGDSDEQSAIETIVEHARAQGEPGPVLVDVVA